jgi:hypothetical protein
MFQLMRSFLLFVVVSSIASAATITTYLNQDMWNAAAGRSFTETFLNGTGDSTTLDFSTLALTSTGRSSSSTDTHPKVKHVDTSFIDIFANPDGTNSVGTVGRTTVDTSTTTTTVTETCRPVGIDTTCTVAAPVTTTTFQDFADVRTLDLNFHTPTLSFGFDYVATLAGSSPNRLNHPFRMVLTFVDGTTSSVWIGGNQAFTDFQEGFMGITSDILIASVTLHAPDRSLGSNITTADSGGFVFTGTNPKGTRDIFTATNSTTISSDQSSALILSDFFITTPEPAPAITMALGGMLISLACFARKRASRSKE